MDKLVKKETERWRQREMLSAADAFANAIDFTAADADTFAAFAASASAATLVTDADNTLAAFADNPAALVALFASTFAAFSFTDADFTDADAAFTDASASADAAAAVDLVLEQLKNLIRCKKIYNKYSEVEKLEIEYVYYEEIISLRNFIKDFSNISWFEDDVLKDLMFRIRDMAIKFSSFFIEEEEEEEDDRVAEFFSQFGLSGKLYSVLKEIKSLKNEVSMIYQNKLYKDLLISFRDPNIIVEEEGEEEIYHQFIRLKLEETFIAKRQRDTETETEIMAKTVSIDFLLESLKQLIYCGEGIHNEYPPVTTEKHQITSLYEELSFMRTFLKDSEMIRFDHDEVNDLVNEIRDLAFEAEDIIDSSIVNAILNKNNRSSGTGTGAITMAMGGRFVRDLPSRTLTDVLNEIKSLKNEVSEIYEKKLYGIGDLNPEVGISSTGTGRSSRDIPFNIDKEETVVGFDNDVDTIRERLAGGSKKLDVISIVGMAGLGKTTLAKTLYHDNYVREYFYIRGWTYVSQVYAKRDLLLRILSSVVEHTDGLYTMSDENLGEELYKRLKSRRYLIVMDDMWNTKAWDDMRIYFPNDNNGSRIMITSRLKEVGLHAKPDRDPHFLRFLTGDQSCDLLKQKVFRNESCPPDLLEIAEQIAQKCGGLPLAIVVVAGLLSRTDKTQDQWIKIAASLSSHIASDPDGCMDTMALSYNHLPHHLKLCFLYFGVFPEDYEINVRKLTWLWIAEGFIRQIGQKTLEDIAEEYLIDLIDRSLVLVAKRKSTGGIRACRVHDLLRDLCLRKGKEENFMQQIYGDEIPTSHSSYPMATKNTLQQDYDPEEASSSYSSKKECTIRQDYEYEQTSSSYLIPIRKKQRRLCILAHVLEYISLEPSVPHIRSLLCFAPEQSPLLPNNISCIYEAFKLLRVLDLSVINLPEFPRQILQLVLLRYLALQGKELILPALISNLSNLETLIVSQAMKVFVPPAIWMMNSLRHIRIAGALFKNPLKYIGYFPVHPNLQTILHLDPCETNMTFLKRTPNLRKLGFCGPMGSKYGNLWVPNLDSLNHLVTLKLVNRGPVPSVRWSLKGLKFPPNLRRLTLSNTYLDWEEMSSLGMLCNLEVLKLEFLACVGPRWETSDDGFQSLKYLRLKYVGIEQWEASNTNFPILERLVLHKCEKLEEIPSEFGNIPTLQTIEASWCSQSTANSAREILKEQQNADNDKLKILINPPEWELPKYS